MTYASILAKNFHFLLISISTQSVKDHFSSLLSPEALGYIFIFAWRYCRFWRYRQYRHFRQCIFYQSLDRRGRLWFRKDNN